MKQIKLTLLFLFFVGLIANICAQSQPYQPTFESLEKVNPVPEWFKDAKFGIYFHWGVFSVPAYANEWYPRNMYIKGSAENKHHTETYGDVTEWPYDNFITGAKDKQGNYVQFAPKLKSEGGQFDPEEWAQLFSDAGARFAGPVAEHHDGFSMWASKVNPWNSKDMGPKLDLLGLFTDAIRKRNMKVFLSMHHAYNITGYYSAVPKTSDPKLQMLYGQMGTEKNEALWLAKHKEIIDLYKPDIIYQDFNLHLISQPVLLGFLSYYYNSALALNKEVVATYKDGLNKKCAVLDYERGGPSDITGNYWLTDDAVSSSSWCYTNGIGYYTKTQLLHAFIDRISKNGNMILNISPKADGSIPQEQKDVLYAMGDWLKKYGEAIYSTRAWEQYGEGPTHMGAAHGVMGSPTQGTPKDIRFTRNKDNTILYAILMGWDKGQKEIIVTSLTSQRIDCKNLKSVELIAGGAGKYIPLSFRQDADGLKITVPEIQFEDMAYVIKITFDGTIPALDKYVDLNCEPHYYIIPGDNIGNLFIGANLTLTGKRKDASNQWKLENVGKGLYKICNRDNKNIVLESDSKGSGLAVSAFTGKDNQIWKFQKSYSGLYKISNKQFINNILSVPSGIAEGNKVVLGNYDGGSPFSWSLREVCDLTQSAYKSNIIPCTIEAEDFDKGCNGDAYFDIDESNEGGQYRTDVGVDMEACSKGTYNVGWTRAGEWMAYTVKINKPGMYQVTFYVASTNDNVKAHLECDGVDKTGIMQIPNTGAYQNWDVIKKNIKLDAGEHVLKFVVDYDGVNFDKMVFEELK